VRRARLETAGEAVADGSERLFVLVLVVAAVGLALVDVLLVAVAL
jgi:hypothetical protein